jgi:SNF2 family DNA or RNA helicase
MQMAQTNKIATLVNDDTIEIRFSFSYEILELVKSLPGRKFKDNGHSKYWTCPLSIDSVEILKNAGFELCPTLQEFSKTIMSNKVMNDIENINIPGLKRELFPFQKEGVAFIEKKNGRALVGSEMGLGKTIQALAWLALHPEKRPVIILCPASLKLNWEQEIYKTLLDKQRVQILQGTKPYQVLADIIIINYDILNAWVETLQAINPQILVIDEIHFCKSSTALRTKATKKLAKKIPHVIALTGTPIINRPVEIFSIVQIINKNIFPNFWEYVHTYCGAHHTRFGWDFSGATNKEELHQKLINTIMIRHEKKDVLLDLPDKLYSYIPIEIDNEMEYRTAETDFIEYIKETRGVHAARKAGQAEHLTKIETLKQLAVKGKMKQAIQWIQDFLDSEGQKLVIFTTHKDTANTLLKKFKNCAVKVDGSVSAKDRDKAVQAFQNDPTIQLFIGNIKAAGTGLTLTAASAVAFLELPWTAGEITQAEDRCHRIGQKDVVNVYYLLAANTIEKDIAELLDNKRKVLETVLDGREVNDTQLLTELMKKYECNA